MSLLVTLAEMSFSKRSSAESVVCSPIEAADMTVVRWLNRPRCSSNVCIVIGYGGMLRSCDRFECTLFSHVENIWVEMKFSSKSVHAIGDRLSYLMLGAEGQTIR